MPFHRKRVRAIDPHNQDNKRREAYKARFLPKSYDLAPKGDDSDVESTVFRDGKGPQRKQNKKRKERDFDFEEEELVPKTKAPGDFSAKKLGMPTLQEGESFRNFKRRLNKVKMDIFANTTADAIARQNEQAHINPKRKQRLEEHTAAKKEKKRLQREPSPEPVSATVSKFGDVAQAPPKFNAVPQVKKRMSVTEFQAREQAVKDKEENVEVSEEVERAELVKRTAARQMELKREKAILAYKQAKVARSKQVAADTAKNGPRQRDWSLPFGNL